MSTIEFCPCGEPLHYSDPNLRAKIEHSIAVDGADVRVRLGGKTLLVPKHYIALHGAHVLAKMKFPEMTKDHLTMFYLHDEGSARIDLRVPQTADQIFSHLDPDDGRTRHFHIPKLAQLIRQYADACELIEYGITDEQVEFVIRTHNIDDGHVVNRITPDSLEQPGIICAFPDETELLVDGNHRFVARHRAGKTMMRFWKVPYPLWEKSLVRVPSIAA